MPGFVASKSSGVLDARILGAAAPLSASVALVNDGVCGDGDPDASKIMPKKKVVTTTTKTTTKQSPHYGRGTKKTTTVQVTTEEEKPEKKKPGFFRSLFDALTRPVRVETTVSEVKDGVYTFRTTRRTNLETGDWKESCEILERGIPIQTPPPNLTLPPGFNFPVTRPRNPPAYGWNIPDNRPPTPPRLRLEHPGPSSLPTCRHHNSRRSYAPGEPLWQHLATSSARPHLHQQDECERMCQHPLALIGSELFFVIDNNNDPVVAKIVSPKKIDKCPLLSLRNLPFRPAQPPWLPWPASTPRLPPRPRMRRTVAS